jgi:hypothetical protein
MKVKNLVAATVIVASAFSCGKEDDKAGAASEIDGTWSSTCVSDNNGGFSKTLFVISGGTGVTTSGTYSDAACTTATSLMAMTATVTAGNAVTSPAGAKELTTKLTSITFTYKTTDQVNAANAATICGGGFVKDQPKTVTASDCSNTAAFKEFFDESFSIYKVDGNKLYTGECGDEGTATDCSAATKRPSALDTSFYTKA